MKVTHKDKAEKLAVDIVENWDLDTITEYAQEKVFDSLHSLSPEELEEEWKDFWNPSREN